MFREARERIAIKEAKGQLDISIQAAGKYLNNKKKKETFLNETVTVEHKTDGVKITAMRTNTKYNKDDFNENWIIAYKGSIIYPGEFSHTDKKEVKTTSIGASQFQFVTDHFEKMHKKGVDIKPGTELFVEFLMNKPTLSSNYTSKHKLVLIGYARSSYKEKNGRLITQPDDFRTAYREQYAKNFNIDVPAILFQGTLGSHSTFASSIKHKGLLELFKQREFGFNWSNSELLVDDLRKLFLDVESKYGGKEEGVVIIPDNEVAFPYLKWQQEYQLDQEARRKIKMQYVNDDPEAEGKYWSEVRRYALQTIEGLDVSKPLKDIIVEISKRLKKLDISEIIHPKKSKIMIMDDIQLSAKLIITRRLTGNNGALIIGKFRVLTNAHHKMIADAYDKYDTVNVALVTGKDTRFSKDLRRQMLELSFPQLNLVETTSGNLITIINRFQDNINVVIAGTDRVANYKTQLKKMPDMSVSEIKRSDADISASKVISNIQDKKFFDNNTPEAIHNLYETIKEMYSETK